MKPKTLIKAIFCVFVSVGIITAILQFNFTDYSQLNKKNNVIAPKKAPDSEAKKVVEEVSEAIAGNDEPQEYILSYDPQSGMVFLTKRFKDKSELISPISSINPSFLEPADVDALIKGITFTNKEEMFMLIEDYSN